MGHVRPGLRTVPVTLTGGDVRDVAGAQLPLLVLGGDDAFARGDDEDLVGRVGVQLVPRAGAERDLVQAEISRLVPDDRLRIDGALEDVLGAPTALVGGGMFDTHRGKRTTPPGVSGCPRAGRRQSWAAEPLGGDGL